MEGVIVSRGGFVNVHSTEISSHADFEIALVYNSHDQNDEKNDGSRYSQRGTPPLVWMSSSGIPILSSRRQVPGKLIRRGE